MENDYIRINPSWLKLDMYDFKILIALSYLSQNGIFRNKLKSVCDFLGIFNSNKNMTKIKSTINNLKTEFNLPINQEGYTWTIALPAPSPEDIVIKKEDVDTIFHQQIGIERDAPSEATVLKLFAYLLLNGDKVETYSEIGKKLNCSEATASRAAKSLMLYNFKNLNIEKKQSSPAPMDLRVISFGIKEK